MIEILLMTMIVIIVVSGQTQLTQLMDHVIFMEVCITLLEMELQTHLSHEHCVQQVAKKISTIHEINGYDIVHDCMVGRTFSV